MNDIDPKMLTNQNPFKKTPQFTDILVIIISGYHLLAYKTLARRIKQI